MARHREHDITLLAIKNHVNEEKVMYLLSANDSCGHLLRVKTKKVNPAPFRIKTAANKLLETVTSARLKNLKRMIMETTYS